MKMKKRTLKRLKAGILFLGISLLLWNCQKEENYLLDEHLLHQELETPTFQIITKKIFDKDIQLSSNLSKLKFNGNLSYKSADSENDYLYSEEYDFYINTQFAITNENEHQKTYTFEVIRNTPKENILENLLIHYDSLNNVTKFFLLEYPIVDDDYHYGTSTATEIHDESLSFNKTMNTSCYDVLQYQESVTTDYPCWSGEHSGGSEASSCDTSDGGNPPFSITIPSSWILVAYCPPQGSDELTYGDSQGNNNTSPQGGSSSGSSAGVQTIPLDNNNLQWELFLGDLSREQRTFVNSELGIQGLLLPFLIDNNFSDEAQEFTLFAIDILMEDFHDSTFDDILEVLDFEQEYRGEMSPTEIVIFDGLNRVTQLKYLQSAFNAKIMSEDIYPNTVTIPCNLRNGISNSYKHALWSALSTVRIGEDLTKQLTDAHEVIIYLYPLHYKETEMDLFNNGRGREIAYGSGRIWELVKTALENGELRYLSNLNPNSISPTACNATSTSILTPTN